MTDHVAASPSQVSGAVPTFHGQANSIADLITGLNTTTGGLVSALSIQPLSGFSGDLESLYGRIGISMNCFTTAMQNLGSTLQAAAEGFATTDAQLASIFNTLDQSLKPYMGYESPTMVPTMPTVHTQPQSHPQPQPQPHHWWDSVGSWISNHAGQIAIVGTIVVVGGVTMVVTGGGDTPLVVAAVAVAAG